MKMKWYISTLILALTVFGIYQNKISSPNQEILVQFATDEVSIEETQTAIENIKFQLEIFGVDAIQVNQIENGHLKISYYSSIKVEEIKKLLSEDNYLSVGVSGINHEHQRIPSRKNSKNYNLDIYELHQSTDGSQGAAGKSVVVVKQDFDRFSNPHFFVPFHTIDLIESNRFVKEAYKVNRLLAIAIDTTSTNIQEVRAGPRSRGII